MSVWAVDGGMVSAAQARSALYNSMGFTEGVIRAGDYKVEPLATPGGAVRIAPGSGVLLNKYLGVDGGGQSYGTLRESGSQLAVSPTTTAARTRYVIQRIRDHQYPGEPVPEDPLTHEYDTFELVTAIPTTYPNIVLAKIVQPAGGGGITGGMITDMREVARPNEKNVTRTHAQLNGDGKQLLTVQNAYPVGQYFPPLGGNEGGKSKVHTIKVPPWATHMTIEAKWLGVWLKEFSRKGAYWVTFDTTVKNDPAGYTQSFAWASEDTSNRQTWVAIDTVPVPETMRGKDVHFALRAKRDSNNTFGEVATDGASGTAISVTFLEEAD